MATLYYSSMAGDGVQPRANAGETCVSATYELTGALVVNDVIQMVKIPQGAKILDVVLSTDDLDTSTGLVLDVGDDGVTDRFIDGTTIGQTGGVARLNEVGGHLYEYTADNTIDVLVQVAPASGAASGTINLSVTYQLGTL